VGILQAHADARSCPETRLFLVAHTVCDDTQGRVLTKWARHDASCDTALVERVSSEMDTENELAAASKAAPSETHNDTVVTGNLRISWLCFVANPTSQHSTDHQASRAATFYCGLISQCIDSHGTKVSPKRSIVVSSF